ncbi:uncharacterized protein [Elaeis guineensis]|uniref:Uncharacterized protein LOC105039791 n=1 Tax=Elaeis guineensis var. tenera TaxID=51953 RepID=A0A6I9QS26_ELAGV|nr:uncharacterized protein LOC105039791 [Elaeis guineensis]
MDRRRCWFSKLLLFSCFLLSSGQSWSNISATDMLDSVIRDHAFQALERHRTGVVYHISLPANLSGMTASVLRLRSSSLWRKGASFTAFHIPPGTTAVPFVRRLVVVYQDWGNWSASYYNVTGHKLVGPVIGFLAYDAFNASSNTTMDLDFRVNGSAVSISFPGAALPKGSNSTAKCARFWPNGTVDLGDIESSNVCMTRSTGHFAIVVPLEDTDHSLVMGKRKEKKWWLWVAAIGGGVVALLSLIVVAMFKLVKKRKREQMVRQAEESEALEAIWIGRSRMPSATMIRSQPVLENGGAP